MIVKHSSTHLAKVIDNRLQTKAAGMSGGMPFAYIQDMVPYSIGDSAKNYINSGYMKNALVYSCITLITRNANKCLFKLMDVTDKEEHEEIMDHPLLDLLDNPAPIYSRREFIEHSLGYKLIGGESFIFKNRYTIGSNKGLPGQLIIFPAQYIDVQQDRNTGLPSKYIYWDGKTRMELEPEDVIFMKFWSPDGGIRGMSPLKAGREVLAQSNDMYRTNRKLTVNGGPPGILSMADGSNIEFTDDQIDKLQEKYRERYAGPENAGNLLITNGSFQFTPTGLKAEDLMLKEGQRMNLRDICNIYTISSQLLNDPENKTYNNMQEAMKQLIKQCVIPHLHLWLDSLQRDLVPEFEKKDGRKYKLVIDKQSWEEIREDEAAQVVMLQQAWWMSINEKRKVMGLEPLKTVEGDDMYVPINAMPVSTKTNALGKLRNAYAAAQQGVGEDPKPKEEDKPAAEPVPEPTK